ncbi:MAG: WD40 repeat domain-containing protein, partial [Campylobacteraceae bacterium]|nr:WD40 repeat domain-containing protein [Campylobacteraceae bacterium]
MLPSSREITFYAPISRMSLADDSTLNVIDNNCTLHKIDLEKLQITKSTSLSNVYEERFFDYYKRPFALGKRRAYLSFSKQGTEYVIDTKDKLVKISHFSYSKNAEVTKAEFSENDKLLISGNERGKVYIINTQDGSIQTELPRSSDTITAVALSDAFRLGAYASFSKKILVYKFSSQKVVFEKKLDAVVEMISFVDDNTLLAITRNGKILKINIDRGTIQETLLDENIWPSVITLSHSKKFVYVGTRESVVFALHVKTLSLLFQVKLPYIGITSMVRSPHFFIVGFKTGEVSFFSHREFEEQFILNIKLKKIKEASLLFRKNIFLMSHRDTRYIYDYWLEQKETITNLLSLGEIEQARLLAEPFLFHPKCTLEFSELELLQPDLMSLQRYFRSSSFSAAYELIQVKPMLRKSSIYGKMEALWNKNLQKAQIVLSRDPILNKDAAKDSLSLFAEVEEKKSIIENMLKNARVFMLAESAIKNKNFSLYFKMVSQNTFLEFTPLYKKVLLLGEKLQMQIVTYLEEKDYKQSLSFAGLLSQFTPYRNQAIRLKEVSNALLILEYQM